MEEALKKRVKEQIPVIEAFTEGKTIQCKARNRENARWTSAIEGTFIFDLYDYRIKPEIDYEPTKEYKKEVEQAHKAGKIIEYCPLIYNESSNIQFKFLTAEEDKKNHKRLNWKKYYYRVYDDGAAKNV